VKKNLFDTGEPTEAPGGRRPNLATEFIAEFATRLKVAFTPDGEGDLGETFGHKDIFDYIYAILHSPTESARVV
jgi:hypothetical protein